jgi:hypothetical protein
MAAKKKDPWASPIQIHEIHAHPLLQMRLGHSDWICRIGWVQNPLHYPGNSHHLNFLDDEILVVMCLASHLLLDGVSGTVHY